MMNSSTDIIANYQALLEEIAKIRSDYGLNNSPPPALMAVSKTFPAEMILPLLQQGHLLFGENKVQEAEQKYPALKKQFPDLELHLIGPLQSNKVNKALALFDVIETIDRKKLLDRLAIHQDNTQKPPRFYIQVNIGEEPQKAGVMPNDLGNLIDYAKEKGLSVEGLMCIPPKEELPSPYFSYLKKLGQEFDISKFSFGMSHDYHEAVALGAHIIRVGSALFGNR